MLITKGSTLCCENVFANMLAVCDYFLRNHYRYCHHQHYPHYPHHYPHHPHHHHYRPNQLGATTTEVSALYSTWSEPNKPAKS